MATGLALWSFAAGALAVLVGVNARLSRALRGRVTPQALLPAAPRATVIRPIRGLDVGAQENLEALLELSYPGELELLFVLDSEADPAYPLVKALAASHPTRAGRVEVLIAGMPPPGWTGKLNAMRVGVEAARGELIAFNDSDTRPAAGALSALVAALLGNPRAGAAFSAIYAASDAPTAADVGYELLVNAWYGPSVVLATAEDGSIPLIMGQLMVFRRDALAAIGGVGAAKGQFVDDMHLGKCLMAAGYRNLCVLGAPLRVVTGGMALADFHRTLRRWLLFSESGLSFAFTWPAWARGTACWVAWLVLLASVASLSPGAGLTACAAIAFSVFDQVRLQRACHGPRIGWRHWWMPALLPLLAGAVALRARLFHGGVDWRGRSYDLDSGARLSDSGSAAGA